MSGRILLPGIATAVISAVVVALFFIPSQSTAPPESSQPTQTFNLLFDTSVTSDEEAWVRSVFSSGYTDSDTVTATTSLNVPDVAAADPPAPNSLLTQVFVPVTHPDDPRQSIALSELTDADVPLQLPRGTDSAVQSSLAAALDRPSNSLEILDDIGAIRPTDTALVSASILTPDVKLLAVDDQYYLDSFTEGALFRYLHVTGDASFPSNANYPDLLSRDGVLSINQTGVTALTRGMQRKLAEVGDPKHFSAFIGDFLASTDITHVSNEVSFRENCSYSTTLFCSDPQFIDTLQDSGVDVVEIAGNHNNDVGHEFNRDTIQLYEELGWGVVGGGINAAEAAQPYIVDLKDTRVALLAYNYPNSFPPDFAIATDTQAGANPFDFVSIAQDIQEAKKTADFVIVDVQYWECYSYPDGFIEYPQCDAPIENQEAHFKKLADSGADMVVGTQAHQPQTFETYNGTPIYYGLGNLYFDQTQWPGTTRSIVLTHYFHAGHLIQTRLTPTQFGRSLQPKIMTTPEAEPFLKRLIDAR